MSKPNAVRRAKCEHGFKPGETVIWNVESSTPGYEYSTPVVIMKVWRQSALVKVNTCAGSGFTIVQVRKLVRTN